MIMAVPDVITTDKNDEEKTSNTSLPGSQSQHGTVISLDRRMLSQVEEQFDDSDERKAQLCFGSCCDLVRACLIVDSVYFCFMVYINIARWLEWEYFVQLALRDGSNGDDIVYDFNDNDDFRFQESEGFDDCIFCTSMLQGLCGLVFAVVGFVGAYRFNKYLVLLQGIWLTADMILYFVYRNPASGFIIGMYIYPHIALFLALRKGKITRENYYKTEEYCCCTGEGD